VWEVALRRTTAALRAPSYEGPPESSVGGRTAGDHGRESHERITWGALEVGPSRCDLHAH